MSSQQCLKCQKILPLNNFTKTKKQCKSCRSEYSLKIYHEKKKQNPNFLKQQNDYKMKLYWANRDTINDRRYKKRLERDYGITYQDFVKMFECQSGKCKICLKDITWRGDKKTSAHIDHCHKSGNVRGILCFNCNSGLGHFHDNINYLQNAIDYLNKK